MAEVFQFTPTVQAPFTFQPTLDGSTYSAAVKWNLFGQRWYLIVTQLTGELVFCLPLLGSPDGTQIESIVWANGTARVTCASPHKYRINQTVNITVRGCLPDAYNGLVRAFIVDQLTFTYPITTDPGGASQFGIQTYDINIAGGYFASTVVYRESSKTIEINP